MCFYCNFDEICFQGLASMKSGWVAGIEVEEKKK